MKFKRFLPGVAFLAALLMFAVHARSLLYIADAPSSAIALVLHMKTPPLADMILLVGAAYALRRVSRAQPASRAVFVLTLTLILLVLSFVIHLIWFSAPFLT